MMKLGYTVSKVQNEDLWYAHQVGYSYIPCMINGRSTFGTKKYALQNAAFMQGLPYEEYMKLREKSIDK